MGANQGVARDCLPAGVGVRLGQDRVPVLVGADGEPYKLAVGIECYGQPDMTGHRRTSSERVGRTKYPERRDREPQPDLSGHNRT